MYLTSQLFLSQYDEFLRNNNAKKNLIDINSKLIYFSQKYFTFSANNDCIVINLFCIIQLEITLLWSCIFFT